MSRQRRFGRRPTAVLIALIGLGGGLVVAGCDQGPSEREGEGVIVNPDESENGASVEENRLPSDPGEENN